MGEDTARYDGRRPEQPYPTLDDMSDSLALASEARLALRKVFRDPSLYRAAAEEFWRTVNLNFRTAPTITDPLDAALAIIAAAPDDPA